MCVHIHTDLEQRAEPGVFLITGVCWLSQLGHIFLKRRPREHWWSRENGAKHSFECPEDETEGQRSPICHGQDPEPGFLRWISYFCHFSLAYSQRQDFYLSPFLRRDVSRSKTISIPDPRCEHDWIYGVTCVQSDTRWMNIPSGY